MKPSDREKAFAEQVRQIVDLKVDAEDPAQRERRLKASLAALDVRARRTTPPRRGVSAVTVGVALALIAVMGIIAANLVLRQPSRDSLPVSFLEDMNIFASTDTVDLCERLAFYRWLAGATVPAGAPGEASEPATGESSAGPAGKNAPVAGAPLPWRALDAQERRVLDRLRGRWGEMPPERQHRLQRSASQWLNLSPAARGQALAAWQRLTPEARQTIRRQYTTFSALSPTAQHRLRSARRQFMSLTPDQRRQLTRRWDAMTPQARRRAGDDIRRWNRLSPEDRRRIRVQYHTASPDARRRLRQQWQAEGSDDGKMAAPPDTGGHGPR